MEAVRDDCEHAGEAAEHDAEQPARIALHLAVEPVAAAVHSAMRDAFRKMRHFLMITKGLSEDEAISLMSVAVDFGGTLVVDANWGVHAILKKAIFVGDTM